MPDVIVIGAGGGGPVMAKELAARGLDVLLLEAGPWYKDPENEWSKFEHDANDPLTGYFRFGPSDRSEPAWFRETPQNSFLWQLAGVGGTTQHYYGNCPRAQPGVFEGYGGSDAGSFDGHRFPFSYQELIPYYEWVEATLPVQTAAMGTKEQLFFEGAQGIGLPVNATKDITQNSFRPQENAILQPQGTAGKTTDSSQLLYPQAQGCTFCGYCFEGCVEPRHAPRNLKAKRSTDNSYAPMALTADAWAQGGKPVTLLPDSYVDEILYEQQGSSTVATGVRWHDTNTGEAHTETAKVVVMAGGCTEDPRLWLNSGLPDPNGWVGRGYTDHYFDFVIGVFDDTTGSSKGVGSSARCDFPGHGGLENVGLPPALQAFSMAFSDSGIQGYYDNGRGFSGAWDGTTGRVPGDEMKEILSDVNKLLNVLVITDDDVEAQNRVVRSSLPGDEQGPIPKVIFKQRERSARTQANREYCADQASRLLRAAGARRVIRMDWPPLILHVQSTMRMGSDPADSVLDANAEARFVERLFISSNSALSNCLGGPNPTLTTQALATRTAEKIMGKYFDGEPWVGIEEPTSSIDDKVTQAVIDRGL
ncbi:MAG TPA: GMC family oxidoreductase N-terminal domain-containing protein [Solirubrobacterales bacterium]|nr:GMC family oxidoreductase N-terminal domain-containing protein [Solirubrobacterales bacterium]